MLGLEDRPTPFFPDSCRVIADNNRDFKLLSVVGLSQAVS